MQEFITKSAEETEKLVPAIFGLLGDRHIIALSGNLGAGKTVLVKATANFLGVSENITSPTFVLMKAYSVQHKQFDKIVHVDCYRLDQAEDLADIGLQDYIEDSRTLLLIEWADKIKQLPADRVLPITIELLGGEQRRLIIG